MLITLSHKSVSFLKKKLLCVSVYYAGILVIKCQCACTCLTHLCMVCVYVCARVGEKDRTENALEQKVATLALV